jgi:D-alanine-D-alanine ligase
MTITVDPNWWQTLFDDIYLITDARTVNNAALTQREVDIFCHLLPSRTNARILDLCGGQGRHTLEFCRRGYRNCTVVDYSRALLSLGRQAAAKQNLSARFIQGDARRLALRAESLDHVMILGNSLGYIADRQADLQILNECRRTLASRGWLLLDVADGGVIRRQITANAWHEIDGDVVVCRQREISDESVKARELVLSKTRGLIRDRNYRIRLYRRDDLLALVDRAGFTDIRQHDLPAAKMDTAEDVGCMRHRLLITARKG